MPFRRSSAPGGRRGWTTDISWGCRRTTIAHGGYPPGVPAPPEPDPRQSSLVPRWLAALVLAALLAAAGWGSWLVFTDRLGGAG